MERALFFAICALVVNSCVCATTTGRDRPKPHEEKLSEKEGTEYDHEAFLGDMKEEYDDLPPEEAKKRLRILVKRLDTDKDGFVSEEELTNWVKAVFRKRLMDGIEDDVKSKDTDKDGKVSWDEYQKESYGAEEMEDPDDEETKKMLQNDKRRFDVADKNKDGGLSKEEFVNFMHPESSPEMGDVHVIETIEGEFLVTRKFKIFLYMFKILIYKYCCVCSLNFLEKKIVSKPICSCNSFLSCIQSTS